MEKRETFASRLGFILISAGCAIGLGDVWRFPYITGQYGGGLFVLVYLVFIIILGLPIMSMELAVGRASRKSIATSFNVLEKKDINGIDGLSGHGRELHTDDVLYHRGQLDGCLFLQDADRSV